MYHFHASDEIESSPKKRKRPEITQEPNEDKLTLPHRPRLDPAVPVKDESACDEESYNLRIKQLASSLPGPSESQVTATGESRPTRTRSLSSDGEYELVDGPPPVEEASDYESDSSTLVEVKHADLDEGDMGTQALPIRSRGAGAAATVTATGPAESDSESDWTLV